MSGFDLGERVKSFGYALRGVRVVLRQHNAWIHGLATLVAVALGFALDITRMEWCAIAGVIGLVWAAESLNTALESLADAAVPERHPKVAAAKDAAAAGVLLAALVATVVGALVFGPYLLTGIRG